MLVVITAVGWLQHMNYVSFKSNEIFQTMKTIIDNGENVALGYSHLQGKNAFDDRSLKDELAQSANFRETTYYKTIPIIAALESMRFMAKENGFSFRTAKNNPRNKENKPTGYEIDIVKEFQATKAKELKKVDRDQKIIFYSTPIVMNASCLKCHGDPNTSAFGNGEDVFGFKMENLDEGDIIGAYIMSAPISRLDDQVNEAFLNSIFLLLGLGIIAVVITTLYSNKEIIKPIKQTFLSLRNETSKSEAATDDLMHISSSVNAGTQRQATAIDQISRTTQSVHQKFSHVNVKDNGALNAVEQAQSALKSIEDGIKGINELSSSVENIRTSSKEISAIVGTIDGIAFQTNLLALNAAVEAARAGEAGAGFAVVAEEVRILAKRTSDAARNTTELVQKSVQSTSGTGTLTEKMLDSMKGVEEKVRWLLQNNTEMSEKTADQLRSIDEINQALAEIQSVTESNARLSDDARNMTESVNTSVNDINHHVDQASYKLLGLK